MRVIDLSGPDGNAFALIAMIRTWGRQLAVDTAGTQADMMSGDYAHLLDVFESWAAEHHIDVALVGRDFDD